MYASEWEIVTIKFRYKFVIWWFMGYLAEG